MSLDFLKFFQPSYLFDLRPGSLSQTFLNSLLVIFGILVVLALGLKIFQRTRKREHFLDKLFNQYVSLCLIMGLLGLFWVWLRYELVMVLSARFWLVLWLAGLIIWLVYILKYQFKVVPKARLHSEQKQIFNKYLPKKK